MASPFYPIVTALADCAASALTGSLAGTPNRVCLFTPGEIAWDDCCDPGGQLAATVARMYFGANAALVEDTTAHPSGCGPPYRIADLNLSIIRCHPSPDSQGRPPTCAALLASAQVWDDDAYRIVTAVACCLRDLKLAGTVAGYAIREQVPEGPDGGCVGSTLRISVAVPNCLCP